MLLVTAATEQELVPIINALDGQEGRFLSMVTGVGLLEAAVSTAAYLGGPKGQKINLVVNLGVTGAFAETGVGVLDICLAEQEIVGDFGICLGDEISYFEEFKPFLYKGDPQILARVNSLFSDCDIPFVQGNFVSVNSVSATTDRGNFLRDRHQAICENMEGAAVARVCAEYDVPFLEIRCVSNIVEDRDLSRWKIPEAIARLAEVFSHAFPGITALCKS